MPNHDRTRSNAARRRTVKRRWERLAKIIRSDYWQRHESIVIRIEENRHLDNLIRHLERLES